MLYRYTALLALLMACGTPDTTTITDDIAALEAANMGLQATVDELTDRLEAAESPSPKLVGEIDCRAECPSGEVCWVGIDGVDMETVTPIGVAEDGWLVPERLYRASEARVEIQCSDIGLPAYRFYR